MWGMTKVTTIKLHPDTLKALDEVKLYPRETRNETVLRLIEERRGARTESREPLASAS